jgi:hypothetical protein
MAGLWDFLQGDDATLGLALLGAGGPTTDPNAAGFGARLAGAVGSARAQQDARSKQGMQLRLLQSQIDENGSQAQQRLMALKIAQQEAEAKAAWLARFQGGGAGGAGGAAPGAPGGGMVESMSADDVMAAKLAGVGDFTQLYQATRQDPVEVAPGVWADKRRMPLGVNQQAIAARTADRLEQSDISLRGQRDTIKGPDGREWLVPRQSLLPGAGPVPGMTGRAGPTNAAERGMAADVAGVTIDPAREAAQVREMLATPGAIKDPNDRAQATAYLGKLTAPMVGPGAGIPAGAIPSGMSKAEQDAADIEKARLMRVNELGLEAADAERKTKEVAARTKATTIAEGEGKNVLAAPKTEQKAQADLAQARRLVGSVDEALKKVNVGSAGLVGPLIATVPGTPSRDLREDLVSIKANLGFAELAAMRANSPTGGALGSVAVKELEALQSTVASLDQGQSPGQLKAKLEKIKGHYQAWEKTVEQARAQGLPMGGNVDDLVKKYLK